MLDLFHGSCWKKGPIPKVRHPLTEGGTSQLPTCKEAVKQRNHCRLLVHGHLLPSSGVKIPRTITICLNTTAFEVFLPKDTSVNAQLFLSGMRLAGAVTLNKMNLTLGTSYMGQFQVKALSSFLQQVLKVVLIPTLNGEFLYSQVYINRALSVLHVVIC
ncbi:uncharacterized protein LOC114855881 isoform X3 [Betta splendens]|uniref:Uncharacterized protein LOC114855881 isoform X3 n=1 Tax=Betta splendens TaxID=158456 RepID=A0A9W2XSQ5_BETSP|nr:uncharacterized protein LOC114855881 isoform X3 [Betta splendens]